MALASMQIISEAFMHNNTSIYLMPSMKGKEFRKSINGKTIKWKKQTKLRR